MSGKRNTEYHTNTNEPNYNSENQLTDFKTYSNEVLLREASVYMDQKNILDSALMCYSIIYKRYAENKGVINDSSLQRRSEGCGISTFFHYYDYIKSNEILKESLNVCKERKLNSAWGLPQFWFYVSDDCRTKYGKEFVSQST